LKILARTFFTSQAGLNIHPTLTRLLAGRAIVKRWHIVGSRQARLCAKTHRRQGEKDRNPHRIYSSISTSQDASKVADVPRPPLDKDQLFKTSTATCAIPPRRLGWSRSLRLDRGRFTPHLALGDKPVPALARFSITTANAYGTRPPLAH
jgi:hypothetical protein